MAKSTLAIFPYLTLNSFLQDDTFKNIILQALDHWKNASPKLRSYFESSIRNYIRISGFRDPTSDKVPLQVLPGVLAPALLRRTTKANSLYGAILLLWIESHPDLAQLVKKYLESTGISIDEFRELRRGFTTFWSFDELDSAAATLLASNPDIEREAVLLMLCCCSGRAPLNEESEVGKLKVAIDEEQIDSCFDWDKWLEAWKELPASALEWDHLDDFISAVQALAQQKTTERLEQHVKLRNAITGLVAECQSIITFLEISDQVAAWDVEACDISDIDTLTARVEAFKSRLLTHQELQFKESATTISEQRTRLEELGKLQAQVLGECHELSNSLSSFCDVGSLHEHKPDVTAGAPPETESILCTDNNDTDVQSEIENSTVECLLDTHTIAIDESKPSDSNTGLPEAGSGCCVSHEDDSDSAVVTIEVQSSLNPEITAQAVKSEDNDQNWESFIWALISENDLPGAYWVVHSLSMNGRQIGIPDWLIAATQAAQWLSPESHTVITALSDISHNHEPTENYVEDMFGLAAAMYPVLIAPSSGMIGWLRTPTYCPGLRDLVTAIIEFSRLGTALLPRDLIGAAGASQRNTELNEAASKLRNWLDDAPRRKQTYRVARDVWFQLTHNNLPELLTPITEDRREEVQKIVESLNKYERREDIGKLIDGIARNLYNRRDLIPVGGPKEQMINDVWEALSTARHWCDLVMREQEIHDRGDWLMERVVELREAVQKALPSVQEFLSDLASSSQPTGIKAAACCLWRSCKQVAHALDLQIHLDPNVSQNPIHQEWWTKEGAIELHLEVSLSKRLLWLPELLLTDSGQPRKEVIHTTASTLRDACARKRDLRDAFDIWLGSEDYRFISQILDALRDEPNVEELWQHYHAALKGSRDSLNEEVVNTLADIEQAVVDGIIEDERSEYSAKAECMNPDDTYNFPLARAVLRDIRQRLDTARRERLDKQKEDWQRLRPSLKLSIDQKMEIEIAKFVDDRLEDGDTRLLDECLARLQAAVDSGVDPSADWPSPSKRRDVMEEFISLSGQIRGWLEREQNLPPVAEDIARGKSRANIDFGLLPKSCCQDAAKTIESWRLLKQHGSRSDRATEAADHIGKIVRYLGFTLVHSDGPPIKVVHSKGDWLYARAKMSASDLAKPIPQFGSQSLENYDIVCLWERPGVDTIGARLHDLKLDVRSLLVFYLGTLTDRQRLELVRLTHERELGVAMLDEVMLVFLATEEDAARRLQTFLRCSLPFAAIYPYTPFQAGDVPREMFFGREDMANELQRPSGSCLVYGGRQLGKSALLRHVQRQFHAPEQEHFAWVEDIKLLGDPLTAQSTDHIWRKLGDGFVRHGLMRRFNTENPEIIQKHMLDAMEQSANRRVLVMLDEADNFLEDDSQSNFQVVTDLRKLMSQTERRFKVIFAGLHHVQRFQGIPNQPLAHFGRPILVGPLEPPAAQQLVREPLEALGYRLDDASVLRILSYTNYHPGLIQLFCHELLKRLNSRTPRELPPYHILQADVEAVYRIRDVRDSIRERFDWTLALDTRYQAIAWTIIQDQMVVRESYSKGYRSDDILRLVSGWWPQGFRSVAPYELRGLLDEMCGLGVLVRNADGEYRLRSPNLVRLMGSEADIESRLLELSERAPIIEKDPDNLHAPLLDGSQCCSPLTYAQERSLNRPQFGVALIFASDALGYLYLPQAINRFIPAGLPEDVGADCTLIPSSVNAVGDMRNWLHRYSEAHQKDQRLVVYQVVSDVTTELEGRIQAAIEFCSERRQSLHRWQRVLFIIGSNPSWQWLSLPDKIRNDIEARVDCLVSPKRWNLHGVSQRLAYCDKIHNDEVCQLVLDVTGGWPWLFDTLLDRCTGQDDVRPAARIMVDELSAPGSDLHQQFKSRLGVIECNVPLRILEFICKECAVPQDLIAPELVGGKPLLRQEQCDAAVEYLRRMGCIELSDGLVSPEKIVAQVFATS